MSNNQKSTCTLFYKCRQCKCLVNVIKHRNQPHSCGEDFCATCYKFVEEDHLCYIKKIDREYVTTTQSRVDTDGNVSDSDSSECEDMHTEEMSDGSVDQSNNIVGNVCDYDSSEYGDVSAGLVDPSNSKAGTISTVTDLA